MKAETVNLNNSSSEEAYKPNSKEKLESLAEKKKRSFWAQEAMNREIWYTFICFSWLSLLEPATWNLFFLFKYTEWTFHDDSKMTISKALSI